MTAYNKDAQRLGGNITAKRMTHGLSRTALAKAIHIAPRTLSQLEQGVLSPRLSTDVLFRLAKIFNCTPSDLLR